MLNFAGMIDVDSKRGLGDSCGQSLPHICISRAVAEVCPELRVGLVRAGGLNNAPTSDALWSELTATAATIASQYELLELNQRPAIAATRQVYKALGKDPSRYRVASEALCRRIVKGQELPRRTTVVDAVNLVSIVSGYAISGLDADCLVGDTLTLDVGTAADEYHGIGRQGLLNIAGMPAWRDAAGAIATPTSDEERTKLTEHTVTAQININAYGTEMPLEQAVEWMASLLRQYGGAAWVTTAVVACHDCPLVS